ncbi:MAG: RagB/SusD family nutrient uptake outer membrane protein [Prevotella sp.]|nr:RagB/SusD family nutrient uptake outer membrane protein [Prevotella sp.]
MKKIIIPMLALVSGVALTSCEDQLDIQQKGATDIASYYTSDADCEAALAATYESFTLYTESRGNGDGPGIYTPAKVLANHAGDDVNYGGGNYGDHEFGGSVDEFRYKHTPEAIDFHYRFLYFPIYKANLLIENFKNNPTKFQKQAIAEVRVLRAYNYFLLACYWGQPPFVESVLNADAMTPNNEKTQEEYFKWVAKECQEAEADLTERKNTADKNGAYRVTKGFANALEGKALMFAGDFENAKKALKKVIDSGKYDLVSGDDFANLFHVEGDGCPEKIFECNLEYNPAADWWTGVGIHSTWMEANCFNWRAGNFKVNPANKYCGIDGWGSIGIPEWYGVAFHNNDGDSKRFKATMMHIDDAVYQTSGIAGMKYADDAINNMTLDEKKASKEIGISDVGQGLYGQSFYLPFKHILRASDCNDGGMYGDNGRLNNIIVMRYAEVLLNYAECCLRTGDAGTALTYINKIQTRAGSKTFSSVATLDVLKEEKSYELWFEGCRFQDILRWSKLDNSDYDKACIARLQQAGSNVPHLFDKLFRPVVTEDVKDEKGKVVTKKDRDVVWEHGTEANSRFYIAHTSEAKDAGFEVGFTEKCRLFPYPQIVLDQNSNIKQNPGWE